MLNDSGKIQTKKVTATRVKCKKTPFYACSFFVGIFFEQQQLQVVGGTCERSFVLVHYSYISQVMHSQIYTRRPLRDWPERCSSWTNDRCTLEEDTGFDKIVPFTGGRLCEVRLRKSLLAFSSTSILTPAKMLLRNISFSRLQPRNSYLISIFPPLRRGENIA